MELPQQRKVALGDLLTSAFGVLGGIKPALGLYFAAFLAIAILSEISALGRDNLSVPSAIAYFFAHYYLYREALKARGIAYDDAFKIISFVFMAAFLGVAIQLGTVLLIIPGILIAAKTIMAPAFLVAEKLNVFEAIGASWRTSGGNTITLSLAFAIVFVAWMFVVLGFGAIGTVLDNSGFAGSKTLEQIVIHVLPVMLMGVSIGSYQALNDSENSLVAVFE